jgi:hypothetical protein
MKDWYGVEAEDMLDTSLDELKDAIIEKLHEMYERHEVSQYADDAKIPIDFKRYAEYMVSDIDDYIHDVLKASAEAAAS